mgnify:CR=1 FL=1
MRLVVVSVFAADEDDFFHGALHAIRDGLDGSFHAIRIRIHAGAMFAREAEIRSNGFAGDAETNDLHVDAVVEHAARGQTHFVVLMLDDRANDVLDAGIDQCTLHSGFSGELSTRLPEESVFIRRMLSVAKQRDQEPNRIALRPHREVPCEQLVEDVPDRSIQVRIAVWLVADLIPHTHDRRRWKKDLPIIVKSDDADGRRFRSWRAFERFNLRGQRFTHVVCMSAHGAGAIDDQDVHQLKSFRKRLQRSLQNGIRLVRPAAEQSSNDGIPKSHDDLRCGLRRKRSEERIRSLFLFVKRGSIFSMPQRADRRDIGRALGKMMFHGADTQKQMMRRIDTPEFREAIGRHGGGDLSVERVAKALAGKDRAGLTVREMRHAVAALQDADLAKRARTASEMVLTASRDAQGNMPVFRTAGERTAFMQRLARERRTEANAEEKLKEAEGTMGLLERMRRQVRGRSSEQDEQQSEEASLSDQRLPLAPKPILPKPAKDDQRRTGAGFQA